MELILQTRYVYGMKIKRHELIRMHYRSRRYMEHLNRTELEQRAKDILLNHLMITEETKIGLLPINKEGKFWMTLWTHVLEEFVIRYGPFPAGFDNGFIKDLNYPDPTSPLARKSCEAIKNINITSSSILYKYGKLKYLGPLYEQGIVRISAASSYNDPSLNPAIHDNEMEFTIQPHPSEIKLEVKDGKTGASKGFINPIGNRITQISPTDYYVFCMSNIFVPRLFLDFDADACLLITKPDLFIDKISSAFESLHSKWHIEMKPVTYLDPLNSRMGSTDIFYCKHFRYSYQKEIRLIWLPPTNSDKLLQVDLVLGSLLDCCRLVTVDKRT